MSGKALLNQSTWRRIGAATIALAALMAVYSVFGGILRDSVIYMSRMFSEQIAEEAIVDSSFLFCSLYWSIFMLLILSSLYMAVLDIRFIRLQFALGKQALMKESVGKATFAQNSRRKEFSDPGERTAREQRESTPTKGPGES